MSCRSSPTGACTNEVAQGPPLPIVIGITAYGHCFGLTRPGGTWDAGGHLPRITIASNLYRRGRGHVTDLLTHEMLRADLIIRGLNPDHNAEPWCDAITCLSPRVLGREVKAAPVRPRRIDGKVQRRELEGHLPRKVLARWPLSLRPHGWDAGEPIAVETY